MLAAVPHVAKWSLDNLPRHFTTEEIRRFLHAFDQNCADGRRDYAMARCLLDIGLRAGETAAIQLDDLNWRDVHSPFHTQRADGQMCCPCRLRQERQSYNTYAAPGRQALHGLCLSATTRHSICLSPQSWCAVRSAGHSYVADWTAATPARTYCGTRRRQGCAALAPV